MVHKKIKVLRIVTRLNVGGVSFNVVLLSAHLDKNEFETVVVKGTEGQFEGNMNELVQAKGITPIVIPDLKRDSSFLDDLKAFSKIFTTIRKYKPDIVHTHLAKAGALGRLAARLAGVPIVIHTFHGHVFNEYFGYLKTRIIVTVERLLAFLSTKVVAVNEIVRKDLVEIYNIGSYEKIISIPLGLELVPFLESNKYRGQLRKELGLSNGIPVIGIIARLVPVKGHRFFIEAARKIVDRFPNVKFLIVGDGELRGTLEHFTKQLGLWNNFIFLGFRKDLPLIYADLNVVVLSSLNEGSPVTVIEALATGKPVVATDVGGTKGLIEDHVTGILVPSKDTNAMAEAIFYMLENPQEGLTMAERGRKKIYPLFDYSRLVSDMERLYKQLYIGTK